MSTTAARNIEMTCSLTLTEREVKMLAWLAGFGGKQIAEAIEDKLTNKFPKDEWEELWSELRRELEHSTKVFEDTKSVFNEWKRAVRPSELEKP